MIALTDKKKALIELVSQEIEIYRLGELDSLTSTTELATRTQNF